MFNIKLDLKSDEISQLTLFFKLLKGNTYIFFHILHHVAVAQSATLGLTNNKLSNGLKQYLEKNIIVFLKSEISDIFKNDAKKIAFGEWTYFYGLSTNQNMERDKETQAILDFIKKNKMNNTFWKNFESLIQKIVLLNIEDSLKVNIIKTRISSDQLFFCNTPEGPNYATPSISCETVKTEYLKLIDNNRNNQHRRDFLAHFTHVKTWAKQKTYVQGLSHYVLSLTIIAFITNLWYGNPYKIPVSLQIGALLLSLSVNHNAILSPIKTGAQLNAEINKLIEFDISSSKDKEVTITYPHAQSKIKPVQKFSKITPVVPYTQPASPNPIQNHPVPKTDKIKTRGIAVIEDKNEDNTKAQPAAPEYCYMHNGKDITGSKYFIPVYNSQLDEANKTKNIATLAYFPKGCRDHLFSLKKSETKNDETNLTKGFSGKQYVGPKKGKENFVVLSINEINKDQDLKQIIKAKNNLSLFKYKQHPEGYRYLPTEVVAAQKKDIDGQLVEVPGIRCVQIMGKISKK